MANFTNIQITNRGRALQAKAQAGATLTFTRFRVGSGNMSGQQIADMTALIQPVMWLTLNKSQPSSTGRHTIGAPFTNTGITTGFYFREWGLFAQDPDLGEIMYCYGNVGAGAEYIPAGGGSEIIEQQLDMIVIIGNAASVSAEIDETLALVSVWDFNQGMDTKVDKVAGKQLSTNDYTTAEKTKLSGIAAGAQVNTVTSVAGKTGAVALVKADVGLGNVDNVQQAPITHVGAGGNAHPAATASVAGFLPAADKDKLDKSTSASTANTLMQRDSSGRAKVAAPTASDDIARKQEVDAVSTTVNQIGDYIQAQYILAGGGTITWEALHLRWTSRFIVLPMDKAINPAGYLNIELPAAGTVIPGIGSSASVTVVAGQGIPFNPVNWHTLYAVHTPGSSTATLRIADYAALSAGMITPNMILVAAINADTNVLKLGTGQVMPMGTTIVNGKPSVDASQVIQNASNRFVTDAEKSTWNAKASFTTASGTIVEPSGEPFVRVAEFASADRMVLSGSTLFIKWAIPEWESSGTMILQLLSDKALLIYDDGEPEAGKPWRIRYETNAGVTYIDLAFGGATGNTLALSVRLLCSGEGRAITPAISPNQAYDGSEMWFTGYTAEQLAEWISNHDHSIATTSQPGFMSSAMVTKLNGIAAGANNYVHPSSHPASIIAQDSSNRFVTDTEKSTWNAKAGTTVATTSANGLMSAADKSKLDGVATGAQANRAIATQAQAQAGTDNSTDMTPLRTKQLLNTLVDQDLKISAWPQFFGVTVSSKLEAIEGTFGNLSVLNPAGPPLSVMSSVMVPNLNAEMVGGLSSFNLVRADDYVRAPGYGVASYNPVDVVYSVNLSPGPTSYVDGMCVCIKAGGTLAANGPGLNVNSLGAKSMANASGTNLTNGAIVSGGTYTFRYNSTTGKFHMQ